MQTFLTQPYLDFGLSARELDRQRLNKQALEAWQIMMTNLKMDPFGNYREPRGWRNHPAVVMWRGYEVTLFNYIKAMTDEWTYRGYKTTILDKARTTIG
jgi:ATP-dependent exoDNAse (exonuclease V) beta subunit